MATGDIYRVTLRAKDASNNQFRYVFHYRELAGDAGVPSDWTDWTSDAQAVICPMLPDAITVFQTDVAKLDGTGKWQPFAKDTTSDAGEVVGDMLPYQAAAVALGYTGVGKTIAKKWIGPISESQQAAGIPIAGFITLLTAFCTFWKTVYQATSGRYEAGSWSKLKGFHTIIDATCSTVLGTQRRRKPGIGI